MRFGFFMFFGFVGLLVCVMLLFSFSMVNNDISVNVPNDIPNNGDGDDVVDVDDGRFFVYVGNTNGFSCSNINMTRYNLTHCFEYT